MGYALGKYIDDAAKVRKSPGHALWVDVRYFRIMRALGVYYGWGNMIEDPETRLPLFSQVELLASRCKSYIGFQVDLDRRELLIDLSSFLYEADASCQCLVIPYLDTDTLIHSFSYLYCLTVRH
jgi:hypothetical protein